MMSKFLTLVSFIFVLSFSVFSQTKSIENASNEIQTFSSSQNFSVKYDTSKYVTNAEVKFNIVEKKTPFAKHFKEFTFKISSLFAVEGIDAKPVRTSFCINTRSKKFYFSSNRNLTLTLDGNVINLGEADRSTEVKGRKIKENLCWEIDKEFIKDIEKTSSFNYEIGSVKGNLKSDKLMLFKDYAKLISVSKKQAN